MLLQNELSPLSIDTLLYFPIIPEEINKTYITEGETINHWKMNNSLTFVTEDDPPQEKNISIYNEDGSEKSSEEIYKMLETWEDPTLFNAFFNGDFEAGNIKGGGENIQKLVIKRLSPDTGYKVFETLGEVPFNKTLKHFSFKDYLIISGQVYLYSIQPVTEKNHYGALQKKVGGLNRYEYGWLIDTDGSQIKILNTGITNILVNTKDGVIETIGGETPFVNRFSNLHYKSFTLTGTIAAIFDDGQHLTPEVDSSLYSNQSDIRQIIESKFLQKTGALPTVYNNSIRNDYNYERVFREKVIDILSNGHKKLFKSPSEGLMVVKLSGVNLTPKTNVGRLIYDFSATVTEVGRFNVESLDDFDLKEIIYVE